MAIVLHALGGGLPDGFRALIDDAEAGGYRHMGRLAAEVSDHRALFHALVVAEVGGILAGIGAMTDGRVADFFAQMVKAGVVDRGVDYRKAYTLQFVDKGVGLDLRPK